ARHLGFAPTAAQDCSTVETEAVRLRNRERIQTFQPTQTLAPRATRARYPGPTCPVLCVASSCYVGGRRPEGERPSRVAHCVPRSPTERRLGSTVHSRRRHSISRVRRRRMPTETTHAERRVRELIIALPPTTQILDHPFAKIFAFTRFIHDHFSCSCPQQLDDVPQTSVSLDDDVPAPAKQSLLSSGTKRRFGQLRPMRRSNKIFAIRILLEEQLVEAADDVQPFPQSSPAVRLWH